jgi:hypothetical protein
LKNDERAIQNFDRGKHTRKELIPQLMDDIYAKDTTTT